MRPRIRTLKPEVWADEKVGDLSFGARLLFVGLITMADDEGRLRELSAAITGHVFPYDNVAAGKLSRWLDEVEASGMVVRYAADGRRYLAFPRWTEHQRVDKPRGSCLPEPPENSSIVRRIIHDPIDDDSRPLRARASGPDPIPDPDPSSSSDDARELFEYWRQQCNHPQSRATRERLAKIGARVSEGYTVEQIRAGIDGAAKGAFVNEQGKRFDDIELICRSGSKLESFIERGAVVPLRGSAGQRAEEWTGMELQEGESLEEWRVRAGFRREAAQ